MTQIAIIGAGLSGVVLAHRLSRVAQVTLFEKSRGFGGRMATRRNDPFRFDHGAQFFTARSAEFRQWLAPFIDAGLVAPWEPKVVTLEPGQKPFKREWFEPHYVMVPGMNAVLRRLGEDLTVRLQTEIATIVRRGQGWALTDRAGQGLGEYDWVISSAPAPQTRALMPADFAGMAQLDAVEFLACHALMLGYAQAPALNFQAAEVRNAAIGWIAANASKPGRGEAFSLLVHSANAWAEANVELPPADVTDILQRELVGLLGEGLAHPVQSQLHRWRLARATRHAGTEFLLDGDNRLAACGDWCRGERVEDAFLSAFHLASALK